MVPGVDQGGAGGEGGVNSRQVMLVRMIENRYRSQPERFFRARGDDVMKMMRSLAVPAFAGLIGLCWASAANAYSFRVYNQAQTNVVFIPLHTVSALRHEV